MKESDYAPIRFVVGGVLFIACMWGVVWAWQPIEEACKSTGTDWRIRFFVIVTLAAYAGKLFGLMMKGYK